MNIHVPAHALARFRTRFKGGKNFNYRGAREWIHARVSERLSAGAGLKVVDQNNHPVRVLDLNEEICAVLKEGAEVSVVLTILTQRMKFVSLKEGWWQPFDGDAAPTPGPKTVITWQDGRGTQHINILPEALVEQKVARLVRGGVDPQSIKTKPHAPEVK